MDEISTGRDEKELIGIEQMQRQESMDDNWGILRFDLAGG